MRELIYSIVRITAALLTVALFTGLGFILYVILTVALDRAFDGGGKVGAAIPSTLAWVPYSPMWAMPVMGFAVCLWVSRILQRRKQEHSNKATEATR